jgi:TPR repeat protein
VNRHDLFVALTVIASACLVIFSVSSPVRCTDSGAEEAFIMENLLPAQQGDPQAQVFVGYLYETGQGVPQNYSKAALWYRKAAEQGNTIAQIQLGNMYRLGKGISQSYVMAYLWFDVSARGGNANAKDLRRAVASNMSPAEIAEAKRMSAEWMPRKR